MSLFLVSFQSNYPPRHKTNTCRKRILGNLFLRECMRGLHSLSREYRKIFLRDHFPHISQMFEGIHFGANTCCACIRTRATTGKYSWRIVFVYWFRARGVSYPENPYPPNLGGEIHPQIWVVNLQKSLVLQRFFTHTPQIRRVKSSPPEFGGCGSLGL